MGAAPSREMHRRMLHELATNAAGSGGSGSHHHHGTATRRRKKELVLVPLTKTFMHCAPPAGDVGAPAPGAFTHGTPVQDGAPTAPPSIFATYQPEAAPSALPLVQQLYDVYREPVVQFLGRQEGWGDPHALPEAPYYATIDEFYAATVGAYERQLFDTDAEAAAALRRYAAADPEEATPRSDREEPHPHPPPRATTGASAATEDACRSFPVPCAVCFLYPTAHVSRPEEVYDPLWFSSRQGLGDAGSGSGSSPTHHPHAAGAHAPPPPPPRAPHGSVVVGPACALMAIGWLGLVPTVLQPARGPSAPSASPAPYLFVRPPPSDGVSDGGLCRAPWELVGFISKSAGNQHLCRALYLAASLYVDQVRHLGFELRSATPAPLLPALRYSGRLTDLAFLCSLREVQERLAEALPEPWADSEPRSASLGAVHVTWHTLVVDLSRAQGVRLCARLALMARAGRTTLLRRSPDRSCFYGFVQDVVEAAGPMSSVGPRSSRMCSLPLAGGAALAELLEAQCPAGGSPPPPAESRVDAASPAPTAEPWVHLYAIVGPGGCTPPRHQRPTAGAGAAPERWPPGTVVRQRVMRRTGAFLWPRWEVVPTAEPGPSGAAAPTAVDVLLAWVKGQYLRARAAAPDDPHWRIAYPSDQYHRPVVPCAPRGASPRVCRGPAAAAEGSPAMMSFFLWVFEHQGRSYSIGITPDFARTEPPVAQQQTSRGGGSTSASGCSSSSPLSRRRRHRPSRSRHRPRRAGSSISPRGAADVWSLHGSSASNLSALLLQPAHQPRAPRLPSAGRLVAAPIDWVAPGPHDPMSGAASVESGRSLAGIASPTSTTTMDPPEGGTTAIAPTANLTARARVRPHPAALDPVQLSLTDSSSGDPPLHPRAGAPPPVLPLGAARGSWNFHMHDVAGGPPWMRASGSCREGHGPEAPRASTSVGGGGGAPFSFGSFSMSDTPALFPSGWEAMPLVASREDRWTRSPRPMACDVSPLPPPLLTPPCARVMRGGTNVHLPGAAAPILRLSSSVQRWSLGQDGRPTSFRWSWSALPAE